MFELNNDVGFVLGQDILIRKDPNRTNKLIVNFLSDDFFLLKLNSDQEEKTSEDDLKINVCVSEKDVLSFFINGTYLAEITICQIANACIHFNTSTVEHVQILKGILT